MENKKLNANNNIHYEIKQLSDKIDLLINKENSNNNSNTKLFGKYHDLYIMIIGFILTGIIGSILTYIFQVKMHNFQREIIDYENHKKENILFFKEVSEMITKRKLYSDRTIFQLKNKSPFVESTYIEYVKTVDKWSEKDFFVRAYLKNDIVKKSNDISTYELYNNLAINYVKVISPMFSKFWKEKNITDTAYANYQQLLVIQDSLNQLFIENLTNKVFYEE